MREHFLSKHQGVTLVELMVMSVIASLVALTVIQGFSGISRGILSSRFKSIATQLAHERMQTLKSTPYYRLRVSSQTVVPSTLGGLSPSVRSDTINYPPTNALVSGVLFTDYAVIERVQPGIGGALEVQAWDAPDTGLKQLTLDLVWRENGSLKRIRLTNLLENPNRAVSSGDFIGKVTNAALMPLVDATVEIAENSSLTSDTDGGGNYRIGSPVGTYTLRASKQGYFTKTSANKVISSTNPQVTVDFTLTAMSSGTVTGTVWQNDHLVISRVCGEKASGLYTYVQEYVEIFNPTTWTWTVDGQVGLTFQRQMAQDPFPIPIVMNYAVGGANIAPGGFYLFASTPTLDINGTFVGADAVWDSSIGGSNDVNFPFFAPGAYNILPVNGVDGANEGAGVLTLTGPSFIDRVGWQGGGGSNPAFSESSPVPDNPGLETNEIYFRKSDVGGAFSSTVGPAYDSGNNSVDWGVNNTGGNTPPRSTTSPALPIRSGTPSNGAFVFADDGLSQMTQAGLAGSPPEARFTLSAIATGTWTVSASSGNFYMGFSTTVTNGVTISTSMVMNTSTLFGFVAGRVLDGVTTAGIAGITINPGAGVTNAAGNFSVAVPPGDQTVTANLGGANAAYTSDSKPVTVVLGQLVSDNFFYLSKGAKIRGRVTVDGTNPLPDVPIEVANIVTGYTADNATSGSDGNFIISVPTGTYSVRPTTAYGETATPIIGSLSVLTGGTTVFSATFTVTSAYGTLSGSVSSNSKAISTGVLIVASTAAIPASPPDINPAFLGSSSIYYTGCSRPDGSYTFDLKNGIYFVSAWYTTFNGNTPTVTRVDQAAVVIQPRQKTTLNLTW